MSFPKKPYVPAGVTYAPHISKEGDDDERERPYGPDFPQTAAARKSAVTEEDLGGITVIDHRGDAMPVVGPELPHTAAARPDGSVDTDDEAGGTDR